MEHTQQHRDVHHYTQTDDPAIAYHTHNLYGAKVIPIVSQGLGLWPDCQSHGWHCFWHCLNSPGARSHRCLAEGRHHAVLA